MYSSIIPKLLLAAGLVEPFVRVVTGEVTCYTPDGETLADNTTYFPCNKLSINQYSVYSSCDSSGQNPDGFDIKRSRACEAW
jgi:hypothetical protein